LVISRTEVITQKHKKILIFLSSYFELGFNNLGSEKEKNEK